MRLRSLRVRLLVTFGVGALALSSIFASLTFFGVQRVLVNNQQQTDLHQSFVNAALIRSTLYTAPPQLPSILNSIETATGSSVLVHTHHQWLSKSHGAATTDVTQHIVTMVDNGRVVDQTLLARGNRLIFVVGVPIPAVETQVFQVFPLGRLEHTLHTLLLVLILGALLTSVLGISGGMWLTQRAVRPLEEVSAAAAAIAEGELTTRLVVGRADAEVQQLTDSFNTMVSRLVERMERDARFASDVSHELRSPLTTMATTTAVLQRHRDELSPAGRESLDLLSADLAIFQALVEDLLEMARSDAGAVGHLIEVVPAGQLVEQSVRSAARHFGCEPPPLDVAVEVDGARVSVDRRRFERVMTNLTANAQRYAGGISAVRIAVEGTSLVVNVDDQGPGVPLEERERIYQRFFRGRAAHDRGRAHGSGLGLALVREHVAAFHGTITTLTSPEGGARFQIRLPLSEETDE